jgi:hypothetical protein
MKRTLTLLLVAATGAALLGDSACGGGFGSSPSNEQLEVTIVAGPQGTPTARLPLSFTTPNGYTIKVSAMKNGAVDTSFNGFVRLTAQPGSIEAVSGANTSGRNVKLVNGVADQVQLQLLAPYGNSRIWAEDLGYSPSNPDSATPPQCSNGKDDNDNGLIDYPADPGCAYADDDTESGGTYAAGVSPVLYYYVPRIADVNGVATGGTAGTPFPNEAVSIDTGYRGNNQYDFSVIVIGVAAGGFYATDLQEDGPGGVGFGSVYAYNFDAPPNMRQCDRLRQFGGESADFYGFTEINYPTWELEEWDPSKRPCLIPEPHLLAVDCTGLSNCIPIDGVSTMTSVAAALTRVQTVAPVVNSAGKLVSAGSSVHISGLFGPGNPCCNYDLQHLCPGTPAPAAGQPLPAAVCNLTADATDCDLNGDGTIDRTAGSLEGTCATACEADVECSEYSNYLKENQFNLVVESLGVPGAGGAPNVTGSVDIQGDGSSDALFNPVLLRGQTIGSFSGPLLYFSGGAQFTIQARCADDIVTTPGSPPIPSDTACVHARTILDNDTGN